MLNQERTEDPSEALRLALGGWQSEIWTAMPGILDSFNVNADGTCVCQVTIKGKWRAKDGSQSDVQLPQCLDVPLIFPGGGGFTLTFPMKAGDEGLIVFASRCIDAWWQSGGIQNQAEIRLHSLSDGFFLIGVRSKPRALANISTTSTQLRNDAGTAYVDLSSTQLTLKHPTKVVIDSPASEFTGDVKIDGVITGGGAQGVRLADGSVSTKLKGT